MSLPHVVVKIQGSVAGGCNNSHCLRTVILVGFVAQSAASYQQRRDSVKTPQTLFLPFSHCQKAQLQSCVLSSCVADKVMHVFRRTF